MSVLTPAQRYIFASSSSQDASVQGSKPPFVKRKKNLGPKLVVDKQASFRSDQVPADDEGDEEEEEEDIIDSSSVEETKMKTAADGGGSRFEKEARLASRVGVKTDIDVGPTVAGSLVGLGRSGHSTSPDLMNGAANGTPLTLPEYKERVNSILKEFFVEQDYDEIRRCYVELHAPFFGYEFVRRSLMHALERSDKEREMTSRMLSMLYGCGDLTMEQIGKGFERLFETIDDLAKDVPAARGMAAKFLARAVADELLPPAFLSDPIIQSLAGGSILDDARALLSLKHSAEKLEHCWGVTGAFRAPVLKDAVKTILREYYVEHELDEAVRCVAELQASYFGHEVAYRAIVLAIDQAPNAVAIEKCVELLVALRSKDVVSEYQLIRGLQRAAEALPDMRIDNPKSDEAFVVIVRKCQEQRVLPSVAAAALLQGGGGAFSTVGALPHSEVVPASLSE